MADDAGRPTRRRRGLVALVVVVALLVLGGLAVGVFEVQTLVIEDEVAEAAPTFASGARAEDDGSDGSDGADGAATTTPTTEAAGVPAPSEPASPPPVTTVGSGSFEDRNHAGEGTVTLLTDGSQTFVRFADDFATENGPDLYAVAIVDGRRVELGRLKGNRGSQNYELPAEVDPATVAAVQVWCKRFDSTFTEAAIA